MWPQMDREIKLSFSVTQEMRLSLDFSLFCHNFLPAFKAIFSGVLIRICFSLLKYAAPLWEFPLRATALTLEGIKVAFLFWWLWPPPAVCILGEPLNLEPDLENIYALQQFCLSVKTTFSKTFWMGHFFIRPLLCKFLWSWVLCNHSLYWGFTGRTLITERGVHIDTSQTLNIFLNLWWVLWVF